jgi:hypothetical protein
MAVAIARLVSVTNRHLWSFLPLGNARAVRLNETGDVIQAASGISITLILVVVWLYLTLIYVMSVFFLSHPSPTTVSTAGCSI